MNDQARQEESLELLAAYATQLSHFRSTQQAAVVLLCMHKTHTAAVNNSSIMLLGCACLVCSSSLCPTHSSDGDGAGPGVAVMLAGMFSLAAACSASFSTFGCTFAWGVCSIPHS